MTSSVARSLPGAPAGAHRARPRCVPRGRQARQPPRPGGTPRQHDRQELAARGARAIVPRAPAAASARPRDPGWGRAPPAPRGARSLSIRVCRLCVLTGPLLRPIGERRLGAITPQGADRQSGCPRPGARRPSCSSSSSSTELGIAERQQVAELSINTRRCVKPPEPGV